jgi:hypothetical protein
MAVETRDKKIGETLYQIILPPPTACVPICNRTAVLLAPVLSGGLGASVEGVLSAGSVAEKIKNLLGPALISMTSALSKADPDAANALMMDAIKTAHLCADGKAISVPATFDQHFGEHRSDTYPIMVWVLWECVKDFFPKPEGSTLQTTVKGTLAAFLSQTGGSQTGGSGDPAGKDSADTQN